MAQERNDGMPDYSLDVEDLLAEAVASMDKRGERRKPGDEDDTDENSAEIGALLASEDLPIDQLLEHSLNVAASDGPPTPEDPELLEDTLIDERMLAGEPSEAPPEATFDTEPQKLSEPGLSEPGISELLVEDSLLHEAIADPTEQPDDPAGAEAGTGEGEEAEEPAEDEPVPSMSTAELEDMDLASQGGPLDLGPPQPSDEVRIPAATIVEQLHEELADVRRDLKRTRRAAARFKSQRNEARDRGMHAQLKQRRSDETRQRLELELQDALGRSQELERALGELRHAAREAEREMERMKVRLSREVEEARQHGAERFMKELLPALDNLDLAQAHLADTDPDRIREGVEIIVSQLHGALRRLDVERDEDLGGKPFDPTIHEAISYVESAEYPQGTIAAVHAVGYRLRGRLLRAARVAVAAGAPATSEPAPPPTAGQPTAEPASAAQAPDPSGDEHRSEEAAPAPAEPSAAPADEAPPLPEGQDEDLVSGPFFVPPPDLAEGQED